jgi:hypothetical protein
MIDLIMDGLPRNAATGAKAAIIAKRAATNGNSPVDIGASEAGIDTYFLDAISKLIPQKGIVRKVPQALRTPVDLVIHRCHPRKIFR